MHETLIQTGIMCLKIPCYMRGPACKLKYFEVMLNIFEFSRLLENVAS